MLDVSIDLQIDYLNLCHGSYPFLETFDDELADVLKDHQHEKNRTKGKKAAVRWVAKQLEHPMDNLRFMLGYLADFAGECGTEYAAKDANDTYKTYELANLIAQVALGHSYSFLDWDVSDDKCVIDMMHSMFGANISTIDGQWLYGFVAGVKDLINEAIARAYRHHAEA